MRWEVRRQVWELFMSTYITDLSLAESETPACPLLSTFSRRSVRCSTCGNANCNAECW